MILKILIGFALGYIAACVTFYILQKRERRRRKEKKKKVSLNTYAKVATTAVLAHGMILTSCSYALSWIGMDPVVDVSSTIVKEIVAPLVVYLGTNTIMNIFEKNKLSFSVPINSTVISKDGTTHKASDDEAVPAAYTLGRGCGAERIRGNSPL